MKRHARAVLVALVCLAGCVAGPPVRVSTAQLLERSQTELTLHRGKLDTVNLVKKLMADRGLPLTSVAPTKDGKAEYYVFSGPRKVLSTQQTIASVGSWYAVRIEARGEQSTFVWILGKPTLGGTSVCSDADGQLADADYWCRDTRVNPDTPYYRELSGQTEREGVVGLISELKSNDRG